MTRINPVSEINIIGFSSEEHALKSENRDKTRFMEDKILTHISTLAHIYARQPRWVKSFLKIALGFASASCVVISGMLQVLPQTAKGDVLFPNGSLDPAAYRRLANNLSSEQALAYRYGGNYRSYHPNDSTEAFPIQCEREHKQDEVQPNTFLTYELGSKNLAKNDYSMTDGQFMHVADAPKDAGVYHFSSILMGNGMFSESPQKTWQFYGLIDDLAVGDKNGLNDKGVELNGGPIQQPLAMARGFFGWSEDAIMLFNSGLIGTGGTYTGRTYEYLKLPPNKRPVGVAVTNHNEFALITVWDTDALKTQVAVVALAQGSNSGGQSFWGDWVEVYPGLSNYGLYHFMKLIGYIDLPGITAATEISAVSDFNVDQELPYAGWYAGHKQPQDLSLTVEANRQTFIGDKFIDGTNIKAYAKAGFAVVTAPSEHKVVFIDLRPMFAFVERMYFSTRENFEKTKNYGLARDQWPYTFDVAPDFAPKVAKVVELAERPTAVKASPRGGQAYVATVDGTLHIFDVGGLAGRHTTIGANSVMIQEVGSIKLGNNPTAIVQMKHSDLESGDKDTSIPRSDLMVVSRGDRRIDWVHIDGHQATIDRTLRDRRLIDPIALEDADNHGTQSYVITIADYEGKQILNYRYGPVIYRTNGDDRFDMCGPFEFGGALKIAGKPFSVSVNNTP